MVTLLDSVVSTLLELVVLGKIDLDLIDRKTKPMFFLRISIVMLKPNS